MSPGMQMLELFDSRRLAVNVAACRSIAMDREWCMVLSTEAISSSAVGEKVMRSGKAERLIAEKLPRLFVR